MGNRILPTDGETGVETMSELVERDAVLDLIGNLAMEYDSSPDFEKTDPRTYAEKARDFWEMNKCILLALLRTKPATVDAALIVRCKDCRYYGIIKGEPIGDCNYWQDQGRAVSTFPDDFCSYGERRTDE